MTPSVSGSIPGGRTGVCRWGLYVSRRNADLTDGRQGPGAQGTQQLRCAQASLLRHDRFVGFDGGDPLTQIDQPAGAGCRRHSLRDDFQPCRRRPSLLELILQAELPGRAGQKIAQAFHAAGPGLRIVVAGARTRFSPPRFAIAPPLRRAGHASPSTTLAPPSPSGTTRHGRAWRRRSASMSSGSVVVMSAWGSSAMRRTRCPRRA
jgi:hypothetical protein